ncbi:MAG: hypothetical protein ACP5IT_12120 [Thermoproteota archaeon]
MSMRKRNPLAGYFHEVDVEDYLQELCNYEVGDAELCEVARPLLEKCAELANDQKELLQCINESFTTTLKVVKKKKK